MAKGIKRQILAVRKSVSDSIAVEGIRSQIAAGLAGEGWNGGYRKALDDVLLALNGVEPEFWRKARERTGP